MSAKIRFITENLYDNSTIEPNNSAYKQHWLYNDSTVDPADVIYLDPEYAKSPLRSRAIMSEPTQSLYIKGQFLTAPAEGCLGPVVNAVSFARHNIPATSAITIHFWNIDDYAINGYDTNHATKRVFIENVGQSNAWGQGSWGCFGWGGTVNVDAMNPMSSVTTVWFEDVEAQYFQIRITNPSPTAYNISRIFIGDAIELDYNISHGHSMSFADQSNQSRTDGGSLRSSAKFRYKQLSFKMATISPKDRDRLAILIARAGLQKDMLVSVYPENDNPFVEADYQMIGKFKKIPVMKEIIGGYYTCTFAMEET